MIMNRIKNLFESVTKNKKNFHKQALILINKGELYPLAKLFSDHNPDVNYQDPRGLNLLMACVSSAIDREEQIIPLISFLLSKGADVNQTDNGGRSSFLMACHWNLKKVVNLLLNYNANIDADATNMSLVLNPTYTVLLKANYSMAQFLLDKGACIDKVFVSYSQFMKQEIHNVLSKIPLEPEALEFLCKYKINKQKMKERMNILFVRECKRVNEQHNISKQQQISEEKIKGPNESDISDEKYQQLQECEGKMKEQEQSSNTFGSMVGYLNLNELREVMSFV